MTYIKVNYMQDLCYINSSSDLYASLIKTKPFHKSHFIIPCFIWVRQYRDSRLIAASEQTTTTEQIVMRGCYGREYEIIHVLFMTFEKNRPWFRSIGICLDKKRERKNQYFAVNRLSSTSIMPSHCLHRNNIRGSIVIRSADRLSDLISPFPQPWCSRSIRVQSYVVLWSAVKRGYERGPNKAPIDSHSAIPANITKMRVLCKRHGHEVPCWWGDSCRLKGAGYL